MDIQKQAEYLIKKFNLNKDLQKFGEAYLVGSVAFRAVIDGEIKDETEMMKYLRKNKLKIGQFRKK